MKKILFAFIFLASFTGFAEAQTSRNPCFTTGATTTQGILNCVGVGTSTPLPVTSSASSPVNITGATSNGTDTQATTSANIPNTSYNYSFNSSTWDRNRSINGALAAGTGTQAVAIAPTSSAAGAIKPVVTSAAASSLVLKASAGNLYSVTLTSGASAGLLMVFDATSAPADGAVTPVECINVAANSTVVVNFSPGPPSSYATGITAVFSTGTNCFNKAASATAFISGKVQ